MSLRHAFKKLKGRPELGAQAQPAVAPDVESTAFLGSVEGESGNHGVASCGNSAIQQRHVSSSIRRVRKKVKDRPVMPDVKGAEVGTGGYIRHDPADQICSRSESFPYSSQRDF